jgi:hypothetical protein
MQIVTMTAEDAISAASVATLQMVRKIAKQRNGDHGGRSDRSMRERWADGIHGSMAEIALSHALNLSWTPGGMHISHGDVGSKLEVRATEHSTGHLLIYKADNDASLFVLMVGHYPVFRIAGCIKGAAAKQEEWWRTEKDPPCFWVPQNALSPLGPGAS